MYIVPKPKYMVRLVACHQVPSQLDCLALGESSGIALRFAERPQKHWRGQHSGIVDRICRSDQRSAG